MVDLDVVGLEPGRYFRVHTHPFISVHGQVGPGFGHTVLKNCFEKHVSENLFF